MSLWLCIIGARACSHNSQVCVEESEPSSRARVREKDEAAAVVVGGSDRCARTTTSRVGTPVRARVCVHSTYLSYTSSSWLLLLSRVPRSRASAAFIVVVVATTAVVVVPVSWCCRRSRRSRRARCRRRVRSSSLQPPPPPLKGIATITTSWWIAAWPRWKVPEEYEEKKCRVRQAPEALEAQQDHGRNLREVRASVPIVYNRRNPISTVVCRTFPRGSRKLRVEAAISVHLRRLRRICPCVHRARSTPLLRLLLFSEYILRAQWPRAREREMTSFFGLPF